jgi:aspartate carbamoyltransferase catalytic subunit
MTIQELTPLFNLDEMTQKVAQSNALLGQDILSVDQFDRDTLSFIFKRAREMREMVQSRRHAHRLAERVCAGLPVLRASTRTSASFIAAMERLGGSVIPITQGVQFSSVSKGETLADTVRTLEQYSDVIVLAPPGNRLGARVAADYGQRAGHQRRRRRGRASRPRRCWTCSPSSEEMGRIDGLKIAMVGDLRLRPYRPHPDQAAAALRRQPALRLAGNPAPAAEV